MRPVLQNNYKPFGYLIHDVAKEMRRYFDAESHRLDLTLTQWRAIAHLSRVGGMSQVALAGLCETDAVTIGGVVERLEAKGLVQRVPNPADSRAKIVRISEKADETIAQMQALGEEIYEKIFDGVSESDAEIARKVLEQMRSNLSTLLASKEG